MHHGKFGRIAPLAGGLFVTATLTTGCPTEMSTPQRKVPASAPAVGADDPRVVQDGEDLYAADVIERAKALESPSGESAKQPGSGRPDESNGKCRLFAPELPEPQCCEAEYGFDAATVKRACGHEIYLGESFHFSCGYFFHAESASPPWFRMSFLPFPTVEKAAESHDRKLQELLKKPAFASTPVPGVRGAMWSHHEGRHWAFLPGWSKVRQLAWRDESCSDEGVIEVIRGIVSAQEPPKDAERLALVPKARG